MKKKVAHKTKAGFPARLYATRETDEHDPASYWFNAAETPDSVDHGVVVGVYELVETKRLAVTRELK